MARQIRRLMNDIVAEHESKRKSEFDTLQSQIHHILIRLYGVGEFILIPHVLDHQVIAHMLQLIPDRDDTFSFAQADAEKPGQGRHHLDGLGPHS